MSALQQLLCRPVGLNVCLRLVGHLVLSDMVSHIEESE